MQSRKSTVWIDRLHQPHCQLHKQENTGLFEADLLKNASVVYTLNQAMETSKLYLN